MPKTYSACDLILYLYNETELEDSIFIQKEIDIDEEISNEFKQLVAIQKLLDKVTFSPKQSTIDSIMLYSKMHL